MISAVIGGKASRILFQLKDQTAFLTTPGKLSEVRQSLPFIAKKRGLDPELLLAVLETLPIEVIPESRFEDKMGTAKQRIARRDPTDADLLALALHEAIPIWSQDPDFEGCGVKIYTTSDLLK